MSRRDKSTEAPMSFFSFQDIIACTTGILVIVTLVLIVDLARVQARDADANRPVELAALAAQLEDAQQRKKALDEQLAQLRDELNQLAGRQRISSEEIVDLKRTRDRLKQKVNERDQENKEHRDTLASLQEKLNVAESQEEALRKEASELQSRITAQRKSRQVHLEGADETEKQYWFVELTQRTLTVGSYDRSTQSVRRGKSFDSIESFTDWANSSGLNSEKDAFCLEVKPDGAKRFDEIRGALFALGFGLGDFGWNLLPQDYEFFEEE